VAEGAARRFERAAGPRRAKAAASSLRRAESGERVSVYLPPALAQGLRVRCAKERRSVSDAVTAAVRAWLGRGAKATES